MQKFSATADYEIAIQCDTCIVLVDNDSSDRSVTNDAYNVISDLEYLLPQGIGTRKVYYRHSMSRYDELVLKNGQFDGFAPCSPNQQAFLSHLVTQGFEI